jgi:phosphoserine phosphatase RsbU/P
MSFSMSAHHRGPVSQGLLAVPPALIAQHGTASGLLSAAPFVSPVYSDQNASYGCLGATQQSSELPVADWIQAEIMPLPSASVKIVVADDDELMRAIFSAILSQAGYDPIEADNGRRALELLGEHRASILVCDLSMPGMDGNAVTQEVRKTFKDRYIHIIMVTGRDQEAERKKALEFGVDEFMGKPVDKTTLLARIKIAERLLQHEELLVEKNRVLLEAQRTIEQDLMDAARAQRLILPPAKVDLPRCSFYSTFVPSSYVSGDMFATFALPGGMTGFYAIDVSGHGVRAALLSVAIGHLLTAEYFERHSFTPDGMPDPASLSQALNQRFCDAESDQYFTMFCGIIDHEAELLHFCQAAYPSPIVVSSSQPPRSVGTGGFPVGMFDTAVFVSETAPLGLGDTMVLFSDGAPEAEDADRQPFGEERLTQTIAAAREADIPSIPAAIVRALTRWRGRETLEDDLSVLVCQRRPHPDET